MIGNGLIVRPEFIRACQQAGRYLDTTSFRLTPSSTKSITERCPPLPNMFEGFTFQLDKDMSLNDRKALKRLIYYNAGIVCGGGSRFVSCTASKPNAIRPDWVWQCHQAGKIAPN
jgi:hypothetical protein